VAAGSFGAVFEDNTSVMAGLPHGIDNEGKKHVLEEPEGS